MSLIITATDFSEVAKNAVNYACSLAAAQKAQVVVIHSFSFPVMLTDVPMPATLMNDTQHDAENNMEHLVQKLQAAYPGTRIDGKVIYGDIIDTIEEYAQDTRKPWMIVIGNSITGDAPTWPDSTLLDAFKELKYPVLAVPPGTTYNGVEKICLAFDNKHTGNEAALGQLSGISERLSAELHVLNVQNNTEITDKNPDIDEHAKELLAGANPQYHILFDETDIDERIQSFNKENNITWLAMIRRHHSFFEGLFHKSHTKAIAHHAQLPILVLHDK